MSLLMDALRKAEEAKKVAQDSKSEEAASAAEPEKPQADLSSEEISEASSAPEIELSMAEMEDLPKRSPVPNLETAIEFEGEDEDYVLPSSVGTEEESIDSADLDSTSVSEDIESESDAGISQDVLADAEALMVASDPEPEDTTPPESSDQAVRSEPVPPYQTASDDDKPEKVEIINREVSQEEATPGNLESVVAPAENPDESLNIDAVIKASEGKREGNRDETERKTAHNVFAAKKLPLSKSFYLRTAVGGILAISIIVFSMYFYSLLNRESTFNIPAGSYVASEYIDNEVPLEAMAELSADTAVDLEEAEAISAEDEPSAAQVVANMDSSDVAPAETSFADAQLELETPVNVSVLESEPSRSAANLQPESIAPQSTIAAVDEDEVAAVSEVTEVATGGDSDSAAIDPASVEATDQAIAFDDDRSAVGSEPEGLISFRKQEPATVSDSNVSLAYQAYQRGSLDQAERLYRQALDKDPTQRDSLLGLANIAARNGSSSEALGLYLRLLERNPSDPIARAGILELLPAGSPTKQEAELKQLLNEYPNVAVLSYAYGNFLALSQRWSEAQQAYFRALQLAKSNIELGGLVNPDYAFNLAVSLEHLNQREPAKNYYREALELSAKHPAGFDISAVKNRLSNMAGTSSDE